MKSQIITFTFAIGLGSVIGWQLKSSNDTGTNTADMKRHASKLPRNLPSLSDQVQPKPENTKSLRHTPEELSGGDIEKGYTKVDDETLDLIRENGEAKIKKVYEEADEKMIADLVKTLALNSTQEQQIREHLATNREEHGYHYNSLMRGGVKSAEDDMDTFLETILSDNQKALYAKDKGDTRLRKVESAALKELANLNEIVKLREDQKDAVFKTIYNSELENPNPGRNGPTISGVAIEESGSHTFVQIIDPTPEIPEERQREIDRLSESMSGVLDQDQLRLYREYLESK